MLQDDSEWKKRNMQEHSLEILLIPYIQVEEANIWVT